MAARTPSTYTALSTIGMGQVSLTARRAGLHGTLDT